MQRPMSRLIIIIIVIVDTAMRDIDLCFILRISDSMVLFPELFPCSFVMSLCDARNRTTSPFSFLIGTMSSKQRKVVPEETSKKRQWTTNESNLRSTEFTLQPTVRLYSGYKPSYIIKFRRSAGFASSMRNLSINPI